MDDQSDDLCKRASITVRFITVKRCPATENTSDQITKPEHKTENPTCANPTEDIDQKFGEADICPIGIEAIKAEITCYWNKREDKRGESALRDPCAIYSTV
jgi:hypothetical protein